MADSPVAPQQEIVIAFSGATVFGIYLLTFAQVIRWQLFTDEGWSFRRNPRWTMVAVSIAIFCLVTSYMAFGISEHMNSLRNALLGNAGVPKGELPSWNWMNAVLCITANSTALLADTVMIYRCWIVYGESWRIILFPVFTWIAGLACTILQAYWQATQPIERSLWTWVNMSVGPGMFLLPFWGTTLALNAYTMCAIIYRIKTVVKETMEAGSGEALRSTAGLLVESGVLYFTTTFIHFVVWFTPSSLAVRIASGINIPTIGIAFNLILIRVGQNRAWEQERAIQSSKEISSGLRYANSTAFTFPSVHDKSVIDISHATLISPSLNV